MHAHTHTYTHGHTLVPWHSCGSQELESLQLAPPSVFLTSSRFLPPQALSRQSCGGDFGGRQGELETKGWSLTVMARILMKSLDVKWGIRPGQPPMQLEGATGRVGEGFTQGPVHSILG